jgi:hypothetical protein
VNQILSAVLRRDGISAPEPNSNADSGKELNDAKHASAKYK